MFVQKDEPGLPSQKGDHPLPHALLGVNDNGIEGKKKYWTGSQEV